MKQRILTALLMLPLAIAAVLWLPTGWFMALVAAVLLLGIWEWARLSGLPKPHQRAVVLLLHAVAMAALARLAWPEGFPSVVAVGCLWWLAAAVWLGRSQLAGVPNRGNALIKSVAGLFMAVPAWAGAALLHADGDLGPRWMLYALCLVWAADTFAYFTGSRIGGPKLAPSISPNKTWAGFWGGLGGVLIVSVAATPLLGLDFSYALPMLALAAVTFVASVVGDLFESLIKRHSGAKDSGALIPGHGGVMDRVDSLLAALPVFALGKLWLGL
ncbi:phosphatidate cytidylyltransferase [Pseudomarimonas salicorniae]|uniref:Phosphatidate cytidylyltransferase n=1 Tax=Pseudomarimonas salicorniae TaxID=2933270 RepID=A0ABT0GF19_9GAMM|nr:phosphatidate cytidylyltransferase [Lysobacter sp. CAU 1642]MCK7592620.1 phosphatidate cytidylyltransferase [Lysobacter sp. CAU 1642]